jgi:hypothetical protein
MEFKQIWKRCAPYLFVFAALLFVVFDIWLARRHLYAVTGYILIVTVSILIVQHRYHETIRAVSVPPLQPRPEAKDKSKRLSLSEIRRLEFEYVKETASQAMNDCHTIVNYFFLSTGSVILAGFGLMLSEEGSAKLPYRSEILVGLSLVFNAIGWVYFMQVVRLRQAWCESARAMNHIKLLVIENSEFLPETAMKAFRWNVKSIPVPAKKMTFFYFSALLISILSAAAIVLASFILPNIDLLLEGDRLRKSVFIPGGYLLAALGLGLYHLIFQMSMYTALLEEQIKPLDESAKASEEHSPDADLRPRLKIQRSKK